MSAMEGCSGCLEVFGVSSQAPTPKQGILLSENMKKEIINHHSPVASVPCQKKPPHGMKYQGKQKEFGRENHRLKEAATFLFNTLSLRLKLTSEFNNPITH